MPKDYVALAVKQADPLAGDVIPSPWQLNLIDQQNACRCYPASQEKLLWQGYWTV
ncbi:MAG: hypothetical protein ACTHV7_04780 [Oleiphilaceae bacterium]